MKCQARTIKHTDNVRGASTILCDITYSIVNFCSVIVVCLKIQVFFYSDYSLRFLSFNPSPQKSEMVYQVAEMERERVC